jgi:crotonobetainyl-CoA:carnitine CoA-transferase CaiB-like acyl-CoA transferase
MSALEGIRILDLTRGAPGPYCTMILADLGAEVIRIEAAEAGGRGGGLVQSPKSEDDRRRAAFQAENRNKKSIALNLKSEKGNRVFRQLVEKADVVLEGFRPGVMARLGLDYESLSKVNPGIVYCSISSYGQDGPYRDLIAHDINSIGMAGVLDTIGEKDGPPIVPLNLLADYGGAAKDAAIGIVTALLTRSRTGKGQHVDISMQDSVLSLVSMLATGYFRDNVMFRRGVTENGGGYPYNNVYQTKDGKYITIGMIEPWIWERFCKVIGREDLVPHHFEQDHLFCPADDPKWREIESSLREVFLTRTRDKWWELMKDKDTCFGKVYSFEEAFDDPQVIHREMVTEIDHPTAGKVKQIGIAIKLSGTPGKVSKVPPLLGEHTGELMAELGYSASEVEDLRKGGDIG